MEKLQYKIFKFIDLTQFDELQFVYDNSIDILPRLAPSLLDAYRTVYDTLLPGINEDGTLAGYLQITVPAFLDGALLLETNRVILNVSSDLFGSNKLIACVYERDEATTIYHIVALPLKGRVPNVSKWMNSHKKDTPKDSLIEKFEQELANVLPDFTPIVAQEELTPEEKGYQPALINYVYHKEVKSDNVPMVYTTVDQMAGIQTIHPIDEINNVINLTIRAFTAGVERTAFKEVQSGKLAPKHFDQMVMEYVKRSFGVFPPQDLEYMKARFDRWAYGMYILDPLINEDDISDIFIVRPDDIRVKVKNRRYTSNLKFIDTQDYEMFIQGLATRNGLDLQNKAIHVFSDINTNSKFRMRMNLATGYITDSEIPYYHIRKIAKEKRDFDYLKQNNMVDDTLTNYLIDRARYGPGMVFAGKNASGKTTLMNALIDKIPYDKSGVVIQESQELFSYKHPHLMFEHIQIYNTKNPDMYYALEHLARNGLLTDTDYVIIGEIKGKEAADFMMASYTGAKCWCSVHAASALEAIDKLGDYVMSATRYDFDTVNKMLAYLGTIVFIKDFQVCEIAELVRWDATNHRMIYKPIYLRPGMEHTAFATEESANIPPAVVIPNAEPQMK